MLKNLSLKLLEKKFSLQNIFKFFGLAINNKFNKEYLLLQFSKVTTNITQQISYAKTVCGQEEVNAVVKCLSESTQMGK